MRVFEQRYCPPGCTLPLSNFRLSKDVNHVTSSGLPSIEAMAPERSRVEAPGLSFFCDTLFRIIPYNSTFTVFLIWTDRYTQTAPCQSPHTVLSFGQTSASQSLIADFRYLPAKKNGINLATLLFNPYFTAQVGQIDKTRKNSPGLNPKLKSSLTAIPT